MIKLKVSPFDHFSWQLFCHRNTKIFKFSGLFNQIAFTGIQLVEGQGVRIFSLIQLLANILHISQERS